MNYLDYYFEDLKQSKEAYERNYANKRSFDPSDVIYKSLLAEHIMGTQDYIIKKLLEERMTIKLKLKEEENEQ